MQALQRRGGRGEGTAREEGAGSPSPGTAEANGRGTHSGGGRSTAERRGDPSGEAQPSSSRTRRSTARGAEGAGASGSVRA